MTFGFPILPCSSAFSVGSSAATAVRVGAVQLPQLFGGKRDGAAVVGRIITTFPSRSVAVAALHAESRPNNNDTEDEEEESSQDDKKSEPLTLEKVASMIEVSFVNGVMKLSQGFVDVLKLFIAAVLTGYGLTIPVSKLIDAVVACPTQSANRPLMPEEQDLQTQWIKLVYYICQTVEYRKVIVQDAASSLLPDDDVNYAVQDIYKKIFPKLQEMHAEGNETGPKFQAQAFLDKNAEYLQIDNISINNNNNPMEKALLLQNVRVMWMTLTVMEEEKLCLTDQEAPAPPIPNELA